MDSAIMARSREGVIHWLNFQSDASMEQITRAIELAKILDQPKSPAQVQQASAELQLLQQSPDGWQIADHMLANEYDNVRFYGALTLQIKLNREGPRLDPEMAVAVLQRLLNWVVQLASNGQRNMTLYKLCSTMATYFIQSPVGWLKAIRQVVCSLHKQRLVPNDELNGLPDTRTLVSQLTTIQQRVAVRFCQNLADDMFNWASTSQRHALDDLFLENAKDASAIMDVCFVLAGENNSDVTIEALSCLNSWTRFAYQHWARDDVTLGLLQQLTPRAVVFLLDENDDVRELAIETFVINLGERPKFFPKEHLDIISQLVRLKIGPECAAACARGTQEPAIIDLSRLVSSYGKVIIKDIVAARKSESSSEIIDLFLTLLTATGYPAEEDQIVLYITEFWVDYAEHVAYAISGGETEYLQNWLPVIMNDLMNAVKKFVPRLSPPPTEIVAEWDDDIEQQWVIFRDNVADILEFLTEMPDSNILNRLIEIAMQILSSKLWLDMEGILYCINSIADSVSPPDDDPAMHALMGSSIFSDTSDSNSDIPAVLRRAVLRLIDGYSTFIKANISYIPPVLTFLFTILETTPPDQVATADHAAKAFGSLASSCRGLLTAHLVELLQQCPRALSGQSANTYQKEKVLGALGSIIQALPSEEDKAGPLLVLIEVVEADLNAAVEAIRIGDVETGEVLGTTALQCLASIAKGVQAPDDALINVDSDDDEISTATGNRSVVSNTFWTLDAGAQIQARILTCFEIISYMNNAGDALEAACLVLRAGLAETVPGPFVFPPSTTVSFIVKTATSLNTPRIEAIITTACSFVSAHSRRDAPHLFDDVLAIHQVVMRLMGELTGPGDDPAQAGLCIEFLQRLLGSYLDVLLAPDDAHIAGVMRFVLATLNEFSPHLKRQGCSFFETLIGASRPNNPAPLPQTRVSLGEIVNHFAPAIAAALMRQVAGLAQRSELDALCKPLRAFVFSVPNARRYLEEAVVSDEADAQFVQLAAGTSLVSIGERRVFVAKVIGLRGSKQTLTIVREFWAKCKGTVSQFE